MATPRADLEKVLEAAGFRVDSTTRGTGYGLGLLYVLFDSYDVAGGGVELTVTAAVDVGGPLDDLTERVWAALIADEGHDPQTVDAAYGTPPIAGRDMQPADFVVVSVQSQRRM